ncbi:Uu.00g114410.m01.CDS01 [Anthostomella pinea]|uniref:Uu.00g114410.m01.CDS01 n=1 Tax=Anthostomella pinea TaxID=933095 RepID=A0AAI8VFQ3_9PEZI|nr:Uu.00g114410.m01.CDS01 [Anthostomella pinea]
MLSSCFGLRKSDPDPEREPLLPQYEQDTHLQRELYRKLHSYQMLRALTRGYMPTTEQAIVNLRTLLASDILNPDNPDLSDSGVRLVRLTKQWLEQFIILLKHKNGKDQLQDLIWFLTKSRISVDVDDIRSRAKKTKAKADTVAAYKSLQTVGSLLFTNADFRKFLGDLNVVGREVFKDSAFALSEAAEQVGKQIEPSPEEQQRVAEPKAASNGQPPSAQNLEDEFQDVATVVAGRGADVAGTAFESAKDKLSGDEGQTLLKRLQQAVLNLRKRRDYSDSVSTLSLLIKRYAMVYSRAAEEVAETAQSDVHENEEMDRAITNLWGFVKSFGDTKAWERCEALMKKVVSHKDNDPEFEDLMREVGNSLQKLLTDPDFFTNAEQKLQELREKGKRVGSEGNLRQDVDELLQQLSVTFQSVIRDEDIHNLITTTTRLFGVLGPQDATINTDLLQDALNVFIPAVISAVQYLPIPRLEVSTPAIDLLLENLIIEPGVTVNQTSFLPYRLKIENYNEVEIRKARFRTSTGMKNLMLIKIDGLSARADEMGFWLRAHSGLFRLADEGIASWALDERGIDIHLEVEVCRERLEQILTLRAVRVRVHKLNYTLRKSKFSWLSWLIKPLLRPMLKATMEVQMAAAIGDLLHAANRELLYARERLRATRIANPDDLWTFLKAVAARLVPEEDPDLYTRVGLTQPGEGVFKNVYAPGSIVKVWNDEAARAELRIEEREVGGWKNEVFETHVRAMT